MAASSCRRCNHWCWNDSGNRFPPVRMIFLVGTCFFYCADFIIDTFAAIEHYLAWRDGSELSFSYFVSTVIFIVCPTIIINFVSIALYTWSYVVHKDRSLRLGYCSKVHSNQSENIRPLLWHRGKITRKLQNTASQQYDGQIQLVPVVTVTNRNQDKKMSRQTSFSKRPPRYSGKKVTTDLETLTEEADNNEEYEIVEEKEEIDAVPEFYPLDQLTTKHFLLIVLLHILQVGFIYRVIRLFYQREKDPYSFDRYRDISFLRLMEAFLESAPQLLLQLFVVVVEDITDPVRKAVTAIAVVVSMISLSLAISDYISAGKDIIYYDPPPNRVRKPRLSWTGYLLVALWNLGMTISRGVAISLFASEYGHYVFIIGAVHYLVMLYWLYRQDTYVMKTEVSDFNSRSRRKRICDNYGIELLAAAFNMFFLFKLFSGDSILYCTAYYTLFFTENMLMISLWYVHVDYTVQLWYLEAAPIGVFMSFMIGLCFLLIYYMYFQPKDMPDLQRDPNMFHPVMTCTLNRLYRKIEKN